MTNIPTVHRKIEVRITRTIPRYMDVRVYNRGRVSDYRRVTKATMKRLDDLPQRWPTDAHVDAHRVQVVATLIPDTS